MVNGLNTMIHDDSTHLQREMAAIRRRSLETASEIPAAIDRLQDWREHVRANPLPTILAAAALGYFAVPSKASKSPDVPKETNNSLSNHRESTTFVGSLLPRAINARTAIGQAVFSYAANAAKKAIANQVRLFMTRLQNDSSQYEKRSSSDHDGDNVGLRRSDEVN